MGLVRFNDLINPDFKVEVKYLKTSRNKGEFMSLRDVLHSVSVPGSSKTVQVIHGICRTPDGGFEAAVADSIPFARTMAANMSSHLAGWISGYLKTKGWKQDSIKQLLRKSFTTQSIIAAENSTFNKHTGVVTSAAMDAVDRELLDLRDSWVDMSLGHGSVQENAAVNDDSAAAFNWEDGASVRTMRSNVGDSDADSSVVYDDSDEVSDEEDDDEVGREEDGSDEGSNDEYASADDAEYEENEQEEDDMNEEESGSENTEDLMNQLEEDEIFELDDTDERILGRPIRKLFPEDPGMVEYLLAMTRMAPAPDHIWELYDVYNTQLEEESRLYALQDELASDYDEESEEYLTRAALLKQEHDENQINLENAQMLFREALATWQQERERELSAQQTDPESPSPTNEGAAKEGAVDANSQGYAGRSSE
jgi:hypothetical protein